ncbi:hypothetical protein H312_01662 [Anncaliia algerae PRA339]|uniref:Uncharacterized protein n=1 Tax=Anncaliia algerae PRA339 TaxID=1288291 RepID=A0A059F1K5_9MICR|nr:hypothetical protein H312_01662 [Anncaliia algerae PRA339]
MDNKQELYYLLENEEYDKIDNILREIMLKSTDIEIFQIYIEYIKKTNPPLLKEAYLYSIYKLWYHYDLYKIINEYLRIEEDIQARIKVYKLGLSNPIKELDILFASFSEDIRDPQIFDEFELLYKNTQKLQIKLQELLENESKNISEIIFLEKGKRRKAILKYFLEKYPNSEEIYFLYSEININKTNIKKILKKGILETNSNALKIYYSLLYKDTKYLSSEDEGMALAILNIKRHLKNKDTKLTLNIVKSLYHLNCENSLFYKAYDEASNKVLDLFLTIFKINESQEMFLHANNKTEDLMKKMAVMEFNLGNLNGIRKIIKEGMYTFMKEMFCIGDMQLWHDIFLSPNSVFNQLSADDAIEILKNISFESE